MSDGSVLTGYLGVAPNAVVWVYINIVLILFHILVHWEYWVMTGIKAE